MSPISTGRTAASSTTEHQAPIPAAKLRGLREALERDGQVVFRTGRKVTLLHRERQLSGEEAPSVYPYVEVEGTHGGTQRFSFEDRGDLERAYKMALYGPQPTQQPSGDPAMFGDDPPW